MMIKISSFIVFISIASVFFLKKSHQNFDCIIISGGQFFDPTTNNMTENKELFLHNNLIYFSNEKLKICKKIDLKKHYILPGLIDSHTHLLSTDRQIVKSWKQALEMSASRPAMTRIYIGEKNSKDMLLAGFTTVRDLGNSGSFLDAALRNRIQNMTTVGPDLIISGPGLATLNTQININLNPHEYTIIDSKTNIAEVLNKYKIEKTSWIKLYADNSNPDEIVEAKLLGTVINAAQQLGFKVAVHSTYPLSVDNALLASPDSIEHFSYKPSIESLAQGKKPYVVLTDFSLTTCQQSRVEKDCNQTIGDFKKRITWLKENNFNLVFGSDAVLDFTHQFKNRGDASLSSLTSLAELGLSNREIILAATSTAAEMLQLNTGKIATDYQADLVIYEANPLEDIHTLLNPVMVISNGKIVCQSEAECSP